MPFGPELILSAFLLFCRIGACLMLMPGFSSARVPVNVRLFIAVSCTLALTPLLAPQLQGVGSGASPIGIAQIIIGETLIGALIGFMARLFFLALETLAMAASMAIGLAANLGVPIDDSEPLPPLVSLISLTATTLFFVTDQHLEVFRGLSASYVALPVAQGFDTRFGLVQISDCIGKAFFLALRIGSPFILFSMTVNFAVGLVNRLTPQIPAYFISMPFVIIGGLYLLYLSFKQFLDVFMYGFANWLSAG
jgi:flagellar biosynthetic protein FliR